MTTRTLNRKDFRDMADRDGLIYKAGRKKPVLHISEYGTITRADVRIDLCKSMTLKEATETLED